MAALGRPGQSQHHQHWVQQGPVAEWALPGDTDGAHGEGL